MKTMLALIKETYHWGGLHFQRFSPLSSWWTWWHVGRHGSREVAGEFSILHREQEVVCLTDVAWPQSLPPNCSKSSKKAPPTPRRPHLLIAPLPLGAIFFQTTQVSSDSCRDADLSELCKRTSALSASAAHWLLDSFTGWDFSISFPLKTSSAV